MTERIIALPWPPTKTSKNGSQGDYRGKARAAKAYKLVCGQECMAQGVRRINADTVTVEIIFNPPKNYRFDLDNMLSRAKQGLDAVAEAIEVDDADWSKVTLIRGLKVPGGGLTVHVRAPMVNIEFRGVVG